MPLQIENLFLEATDPAFILKRKSWIFYGEVELAHVHPFCIRLKQVRFSFSVRLSKAAPFMPSEDEVNPGDGFDQIVIPLTPQVREKHDHV